MSHEIKMLPVDPHETINEYEEARIKPYLAESSALPNFHQYRPYLIAALLFLVLSFPFIDSLLKQITSSGILVLLIKVVLFIVILYALQ